MSEQEVQRIVKQVMRGYVPLWVIPTVIMAVAIAATAWGTTQNDIRDLQQFKVETKADLHEIKVILLDRLPAPTQTRKG